jgi:beta-lactamase class A
MRCPRSALSLLAGLVLVVACGDPTSSVRIEPLARESPAALPSAPIEASAVTVPVAPPTGTPAVPTARDVLGQPAAPTAAEPGTGDDPALLMAIQETLGDDLDHYSVVVRRLTDGRHAAINADRVYYAASLFKLALLYEAERQRSDGRLDFDTALEIRDEDVAEDLGTIGALAFDADGSLPLRAAIEAMVTLSDNTTAVALLRLLTPAAVDRTLAGLGLSDTSLNSQALPTTAADMALLMEAIVRGTDIDPAWREDMIGLLLHQETRYGIPQLLPANVPVGNKTGTWPNATHDVAFVDAPGGLYVIAVLSDYGWVWGPIARVSRAVYDTLTRGE